MSSPHSVRPVATQEGALGCRLVTLLLFGSAAGLILSPLYRVYSPVALVATGTLGAVMGMVLAYFAAARRWGILVTISIGLLGAYAGALVLRIFGGLTVHEPPTVGLLRSAEHTSELQSRGHFACRLPLA